MRIALIRSGSSKVTGVLLQWKERFTSISIVDAPKPQAEYWRICESCHLAEATVFCRSHARYFCSVCVAVHNIDMECDLLSQAAARAFAERNLCR